MAVVTTDLTAFLATLTATEIAAYPAGVNPYVLADVAKQKAIDLDRVLKILKAYLPASSTSQITAIDAVVTDVGI